MAAEYRLIKLSAKTERGAKSEARRIARTNLHISPSGEPWYGWKSGIRGFYWTTPAYPSDGRGQLTLIDHGGGSFSATFVPSGADFP